MNTVQLDLKYSKTNSFFFFFFEKKQTKEQQQKRLLNTVELEAETVEVETDQMHRTGFHLTLALIESYLFTSLNPDQQRETGL